MKIRTLTYIILSLALFCCKSNSNTDKCSIVETETFSKKDYYRYVSKSDYHIGNDSFKAILYSNVKPLEENKNTPEKIYTFQSYYKDSKKTF